MLLAKGSVVLACGVLMLASAAPFAQDRRGPSTADERKQALEYIRQWRLHPPGPQAKDQFSWVLKLFADVPDMTVHLCTILDKLPKGDQKDSSTVFGGQFMGQAEFLLENPGKEDDRLAEYQAGIEGALQVYELLLKTNPKDRQPNLDDLIQRREAGALREFVNQRAAASCSK